MISLFQFRRNLYPIFNIMTKTALTVEVVYKGVVYEVSLTPTDKKAHIPRKRKRQLDSEVVEAEDCSQCNSIAFAGVCMNSSCISNKK